jgi:hypothetical protein
MCRFKIIFLGLSLLFSPIVMAQEDPASGEKDDIFGSLMDALGGAAKDVMQDKVDEFSGTYSGRLDEIRLVDRLGNRIVLDVTYKGIKASDGVNVQAEVLSGGVPLDGFSTQLTPVSGKEGRVRLTIKKFAVAADEGWGLTTDTSETFESDQIRLFLVRETHPDRSFGQIVYDLPKTWSSSSEPDEAPAMTGQGGGAIELAEGETLESEGSESVGSVKPFYPAGVVLAPAKMPTAAVSQQPPQVVGQPQKQPQLAKAMPRIQSYNFYTEANARRAKWRGTGGALALNGTFQDKTGSIRTIVSGKLSTGNFAKDMLLVDLPRRARENGYILGTYPAMRLDNGLHFKVIAGYIKGAHAKKGAVFIVNVIDVQKRSRHQIIKRKVAANEIVRLDANLSHWAGKDIRIELKVDANGNKTPDRAVWVKPRISR